MAEGGIHEASISVVASSDQYFDIQCDPCHGDGTVSEGVAFCTVCTEYLCSTCLRAHKNSRASRGHPFLEGRDLPSKRTKVQATSAADHGELCERHQKPISKFCRPDNAVLCDICLTMGHGKCEGVVDISNACRTDGGPEKTDWFLSSIQALLDRFNSLNRTKHEEKQTRMRQKQVCLEKIKQWRTDINTLLEQLENDIRKEIDDLIEKENKSALKRITTIENAIKALEIANGDVKRAVPLGNVNSFIAVKRAEAGLKSGQRVLEDTQKDMEEMSILFEPNSILVDLLVKCKTFGKVIVNMKPMLCTPKLVADTIGGNVLPRSLRDGKLHKLDWYAVTGKGESKQCDITGILVLPSDGIVICDHANSKVKLLDSSFQILSYVETRGRPWDVAAVSNTEAVVTVPGEQMIVFIEIEERKLRQGKSVTLKKKCWGVVHVRGDLYISCHNNPGQSEVIVLDRHGQLVRKIPGTDNFRLPYYIAVDLEDRLYVSDWVRFWDTGTVTCMTMSGQTVYRRSVDETGVARPRGLLVDTDNHLYIVGAQSKKLQILKPDGTVYRSLLWKDGGLSSPRTIAYRDSDKTLMVGMEAGIQCFKFIT